MARLAELTRERAAHIDRSDAGERWIARLLRGGALFSGALFFASLVVELAPGTEDTHVLIDVLRKGAASVLLLTPLLRLVVAGLSLGLRGEWRYTLYALVVLGLMAVAVSAGMHV